LLRPKSTTSNNDGLILRRRDRADRHDLGARSRR
jgi:hypothetical protein